MLRVAVGQAEDIDTRNAVQTAISRCKQQLGSRIPQAGILFCNVDFDHPLALSEILGEFPDMELIGGTTGGEFSSDFGFSDDSVVLILFHADAIEISAGIGRKVAIDPTAAVESAVAQARKGLAGPERLCLAFPEGIIASADAVVQALNRALDPGCMVFGGVPSRHYETPAPTLQFFRDEVLEDAVPLLLFSGNIHTAFAISNSWKPVGTRTQVTRARGYEIRRIGKMRALDFYRYYLGEHRAPALEFPLAVYEENTNHFYIRSPSNYDEKQGGIFFSSPISEGAEVQLTEATRNRVIRDTNDSIAGIVNDYRTKWRPRLALAFSCATRKQILGTRSREELQILKNHLPHDVPICGFYTFGELAPLKNKRSALIHNCTLVTVLIGDTDAVLESETVQIEQGPHAMPSNGSLPWAERVQSENRFLRKKLMRSEYYRERLERTKDRNDVLFRKINRELKRAHLEIKHKNQLLGRSLALANEIQRNLLPQTNPNNPYLDIASRCIYCSATGGDYFDFIMTGESTDHRLGVVVGDVTGHGIEAALLMTTARALLRSRSAQAGSAAQIITDVNRHLSMDLKDSGRFMTLFCLLIDPAAGRLKWVRAGHEPVIFYDPSREAFHELRGNGIALGVDPNWQYQEYGRAITANGQIIFMGTDGIWETRNSKGRMFGKHPIHELIRDNAAGSAADIVTAVIDALDRFRGRSDPEDDITLVAIKLKNTV
jgi:serine phosphatase RsbU (regulator of sigma subunit)